MAPIVLVLERDNFHCAHDSFAETRWTIGVDDSRLPLRQPLSSNSLLNPIRYELCRRLRTIGTVSIFRAVRMSLAQAACQNQQDA
ncbi:MAG TPA: hypothetical protein DCR55_04440 [Lentisphaeria bacterium]|nr:hypothetical protein [Lentisphaeria bacterium]